MSKMILVAESGSDITPEMAQENGIVIVPMHVSFGGKTYDVMAAIFVTRCRK